MTFLSEAIPQQIHQHEFLIYIDWKRSVNCLTKIKIKLAFTSGVLYCRFGIEIRDRQKLQETLQTYMPANIHTNSIIRIYKSYKESYKHGLDLFLALELQWPILSVFFSCSFLFLYSCETRPSPGPGRGLALTSLFYTLPCFALSRHALHLTLSCIGPCSFFSPPYMTPALVLAMLSPALAKSSSVMHTLRWLSHVLAPPWLPCPWSWSCPILLILSKDSTKFGQKHISSVMVLYDLLWLLWPSLLVKYIHIINIRLISIVWGKNDKYSSCSSPTQKAT